MMKYSAFVFMLTMVTPGLAEEVPVKPIGKEEVIVKESSAKVHPTNAAGFDLIAQKHVRFIVKVYADGSKVWVPMPGMQIVVSKDHVKIYNDLALKQLPKHLHEAHMKHTGDSGVKSEPAKSDAIKVDSTKSEHPKNAAGADLIAGTQIYFVVNIYADGTKTWKPMPGVKTFVSKKHLKIFNKQAFEALPGHLKKAHQEHTQGKGDEEVASLVGLGSLFGDVRTQKVEGAMVGDAIKFVGNFVTGNMVGAGTAVVSFGKDLVGGIMQLSNSAPGSRVPLTQAPFPM